MKSVLYLFILLGVAVCGNRSYGQIITTIAGSGRYGVSGDGGWATAATLSNAIGITTDSAGNVYFADRDANRVRKVSTNGLITNFAGGGYGGLGDGGPATAGTILEPFNIAADVYGNIYICDQENSLVRKVSTAGIITTVAGNGGYLATGDGGPATDAEIGNPCGIAVDKRGNLYIGSGAGRVRKVNAAGIISTYAGSDSSGYRGDGGPATAALLRNAAGLAVDSSGILYIADFGSNRVRMVDHAGIIHTIAGNDTARLEGDGRPATLARVYQPTSVAVDFEQNVYITTGNKVREVVGATGIIQTIAGADSSGFSGDGGPATAAQLSLPQTVSVQGGGDIYIGDYFNYRIRKITRNHRPYFFYGSAQHITVCENSPPISLNSILSINDADSAQVETWSVATPPGHSVLAATFSAPATGHVIIPGGLSYRPATGFSGTDSFIIEICDGWLADTTLVRVTVIPVYDSGLITGPGDLCIGTPGAYTANIAGGAWSCSAGARVTAGELAGLSAGTSVISYIVGNSCGADTALLAVNIWPVVTPGVAIAGRDTMCAGTPVTFTATGNNGGTAPHYQWFRNGRAAGGDSTHYWCDSLGNGDIISCQLTSTAHCATTTSALSNSITTVVRPRVVPSVTISGYAGAILCEGTSVTLEALPVNGGASPRVQWLRDTTLLATGMNFPFLPANRDVVICKMTSDAFCPVPATVADSTVRFVVFPLETPFVRIHSSFDTAAYPGQIVAFEAEQTFGGSISLYQWFQDGAPVAGATANTYATQIYTSHSIFCVATSNLPCATTNADTSAVATVFPYQPLGVPSISGSDHAWSLCPNPNNGSFLLKGTVAGDEGTYAIIDMLGKLRRTGDLTINQHEVAQKIELAGDLPDGQYIIRILSGADNVALHFVVAR